MHKPIRQMSDTELAEHISSFGLRALHLIHNDTAAIRDHARKAVAILAEKLEASDEEFDNEVPKALMALAMLDHMTDVRTAGMVCDYLNF